MGPAYLMGRGDDSTVSSDVINANGLQQRSSLVITNDKAHKYLNISGKTASAFGLNM